MSTFENPANNYKEEVDSGACFGMFFFGAFYLAYKGLWKHVLIWLLAVGIPAVASGGPFLLISLPLATIIYTAIIQGILESDYLRRGWKDVSKESNNSMYISPGLAPQVAIPEFKKCPFCAEDIRQEAIRCKHCKSDLI